MIFYNTIIYIDFIIHMVLFIAIMEYCVVNIIYEILYTIIYIL